MFVPQFIPPVPITLPSYLAVSLPSIPTLHSPLPAQPTQTYIPSLPSNAGGEKQPLEFLRHLAQEYKSSSGWTEPLNLSKKPNRLETSRNMPSSFAPLAAAKKDHNFLNEVSTFHFGRTITPGIEVAKQKSLDEPNGIPITSSSISGPNLLVMPQSSSQAKPYKQSNQVPDSKPSLPSTKSTSSSFPLDPYGGMEIQIPLSLLQTWIKDGLILSSNRQQIPEPKPNDASSPPEKRLSKTADNHLLDYPADLSLKALQKSTTKTDTKIGESQASESSRFSHINLLRSPFYTPVPFFKPSNLQEIPIKHAYSATTRTQDQTGLKSPTQAKDGSISGSAKTHAMPEKPPTSPLSSKDGTASATALPLVRINPDHLKMLFLNPPFNIDREKIC